MDINLNQNDFPDIISYLNNGNPTLRSPNSVYEISLMLDLLIMLFLSLDIVDSIKNIKQTLCLWVSTIVHIYII